MKTTVVHVLFDDFDIYIGRENKRYGLKESIWHNPFKLPQKATIKDREECIEKYREYLMGRPDLLAKIGELKGKRLGCWCRPISLCHGDILKELADKS